MRSHLPEGYGAKSRGDLMKQYQQMQEEMEQLQQELQQKEYTAQAGGGMVTATVNGAHEVLSVQISPEVIDPQDAEMLGDLVAAAVNGAVSAASDDYTEQMQTVTGGMQLPGLM